MHLIFMLQCHSDAAQCEAKILIELGMIDEYCFVVSPIVAGEGRRLLEGVSLQERLQLNLVESTIFESGCVALHYVKH